MLNQHSQSLNRILNVVRFHYITIEKSIITYSIAIHFTYYNKSTGGMSYRNINRYG